MNNILAAARTQKGLAFVSIYFLVVVLTGGLGGIFLIRDNFVSEPKAYLALAVIALCMTMARELLRNEKWAFWFFTIMSLNLIVVGLIVLRKTSLDSRLFIFYFCFLIAPSILSLIFLILSYRKGKFR